MIPRSERRGSIALVLLVAVLLVVAASGLMMVGRHAAGPYVTIFLALLAVIGVFAVFNSPPACCGSRPGNRQPDAQSVINNATTASSSPTAPGGLFANAAYRVFTDAVRLEKVRRSSACSSATHVGGGLSSAQGGAGGAAAAGGVRMAGRAGPRGGFGTVRPLGEPARPERRCGPLPTSPATASARRTCSRSSSTPSTISIMRRRFLLGRRPATSSSQRRWPATTVSPRSDRAAAALRRARRQRGAATHRPSGRGQDRGPRSRPAPGATAVPRRCASTTRSRSQPTPRRARRARSSSTAPATTAPIRNAPRKCASRASSTTPRWRSPRSTGAESSPAPMRRSPIWSRAFSRWRRAPPRAVPSSASLPRAPAP